MGYILFQKPQKRGRFIVYSGTLLLLSLLTGCATLSAEHAGSRNHLETPPEKHLAQINPEVRAMLDLKPVKQTMNIVVWTDKKTYRIGDEIIFFFRSNQDSYLTLFDIGSSGNLRIIFPNENNRSRLFKRGKIEQIPAANSHFGIQVTGPLGLERIKVIATQKPWLSAPSHSEIGFSSIAMDQTRGSQSLRHAFEKLKKIPWAEAEIEIMIMEGNRDPTNPFGQERQVKPKPPEKPIDITGTPGRRPETQFSESKPTDSIP